MGQQDWTRERRCASKSVTLLLLLLSLLLLLIQLRRDVWFHLTLRVVLMQDANQGIWYTREAENRTAARATRPAYVSFSTRGDDR